jgi:hypothetical protein
VEVFLIDQSADKETLKAAGVLWEPGEKSSVYRDIDMAVNAVKALDRPQAGEAPRLQETSTSSQLLERTS